MLVVDWRIDCQPQAARLAPLLTEKERHRASSYRFAEDRVAFVVARGGLKMALGLALGVPPGLVSISEEKGGKPFLDRAQGESSLRFNLSHSGGLALLAVAVGQEVGIDVEFAPTDRTTPQAVAAKVFTPRERHLLDRAPVAERNRLFFRLWTCKEAALKLTGDGLQADLPSIDVSDAIGQAAWVKLPASVGRATRCWLQELPAGHDYVAALATEHEATDPVSVSLDLSSMAT